MLTEYLHLCVCVQVHTMKILRVFRAFATHSAEACDFNKYMIDSLLANALGIYFLKMPDVMLDA